MQRDNLTLSARAVGGIPAVVVFLVIVTALVGHFSRDRRNVAGGKTARISAVRFEVLRDQQLERVNAYRWVDRDRGIVAIPVDRAMKLVVRERRAQEKQPSR